MKKKSNKPILMILLVLFIFESVSCCYSGFNIDKIKNQESSMSNDNSFDTTNVDINYQSITASSQELTITDDNNINTTLSSNPNQSKTIEIKELTKSDVKNYLKMELAEINKLLNIEISEIGTLAVMGSYWVFPFSFSKELGLVFIFHSKMDDDKPMYITISEGKNVTGFNLNGAKPGMLFEEIIDKMDYGQIEKTWIATDTNTAYMLTYDLDGLVYKFVSYNESGKYSKLYISLAEQEITIADIKKYLNMKMSEIVNLPDITIDENGYFAFLNSDINVRFLFAYSKELGLFFIFSSEDDVNPIYILCWNKKFNLNGVKCEMTFQEIIDKIGYGEIEEISSTTQTKTQYVLKYVVDGLEYNFVSDSQLGDHTELYIALSES